MKRLLKRILIYFNINVFYLKTEFYTTIKKPYILYKIKSIKKNQNLLKNIIKNKIKKHEKIKVCFSVVSDSSFSARLVFEKMLNDKIFEPYILIIPDISLGNENIFRGLNRTYKNLSAKYPNVYNSYDYDKKKFVDYSKHMDLCFFSNIYDTLTHKLYSIQYLSSNGVLGLYSFYGYVISKNLYYMFSKMIEYNILWKNFALENFEYAEHKKNKYQLENTILFGYCKMDILNRYKLVERHRKKIIISPHHTVGKDWDMFFSLSNFIEYADSFLEIPKNFPEIDFVFRPHPRLFRALIYNHIWTKEKVDMYLKNMQSMSNIEIQDGGDYFETFINSDGLIHDCGSFSAEYLFTGKPCCWIEKDKKHPNKFSNLFHKRCIEQHYKAFNKKDIFNFIENVIIKGNDPLKNQRKEFFEKNLKINYPKTSDIIIKYLKKEFDCI